MRSAARYVRSHAVAFLALFVALGGGAIAAIPDCSTAGTQTVQRLRINVLGVH